MPVGTGHGSSTGSPADGPRRAAQYGSSDVLIVSVTQ